MDSFLYKKRSLISNNDVGALFFENSISPFLILKGNLDFVNINKAAIDFIGLREEHLIGQNIIDIFPSLESSFNLETFQQVLLTGVPMYFEDITFKKQDVEFKFSLRIFNIDGYLGISMINNTSLISTINKLKNAQTLLKEANHDLELKNKELEDYSYATAHDLSSPVKNMQGLLNMVSEDYPTTSEFATFIKKMQIVTDLMCDKITGLNKVIAVKSTFSELKDEIVFSDIFNNIKLSHSVEIIESRVIIKESFLNYSKINYNRFQLESVLQNLMSNALKYRDPNRRLVIEIGTNMIEGKIHLTFKDNGLGFEQKFEDKIFGLFKRMHTHVDGLGIGLYIISSIICKNGGKIDVASQVNEGTEFDIQF